MKRKSEITRDIANDIIEQWFTRQDFQQDTINKIIKYQSHYLHRVCLTFHLGISRKLKPALDDYRKSNPIDYNGLHSSPYKDHIPHLMVVVYEYLRLAKNHA